MKTRAEREAIALDQLDELRVINPRMFAKMIRLLARLAAKAVRS